MCWRLSSHTVRGVAIEISGSGAQPANFYQGEGNQKPSQRISIWIPEIQPKIFLTACCGGPTKGVNSWYFRAPDQHRRARGKLWAMGDIAKLVDLVLTGQHPKLCSRCFVDRISAVLEDHFGASMTLLWRSHRSHGPRWTKSLRRWVLLRRCSSHFSMRT